MIRDGRDIPSGANLEFDVCVAGAGPAGLALAEQLAASGTRVVVLESGPARPGRETARLNAGRRSGPPYFRLERARTRAVGGSSWQWARGWPAEGGMRSRRLDPVDFAVRGHVPGSGWPFGAEELEPWYVAAEARCGIEGPVAAEVALGAGLESAACGFGPPDAFRSGEALQGRENATLITGATVLALTPGSDGTVVESLRCGTLAGTGFTVRARAFVLAGGGIENARMLLSSPFGRPGAVANAAGQVGRHFMEHLHVESGRLDLARGAEFDPSRYRRHLADGVPAIRMLRLDAETQRERGLLNSTVELRGRDPLFLSGGVRSLAELAWAVGERQRPPRAREQLAAVARRPGDVVRAVARRIAKGSGLGGEALALVITSEQAPNPRSRVSLDSRRDRFGIPLAHLHWELTPLDVRSIRGTQDALDAGLQALGIGRVSAKWGEDGPEPYLHGCRHHIGTTRMSATAEGGVVDADCRVHGLRNLFMAGSSVMPTAGAVTVTLTAVALALRLAGHIKREVL
jgi:choline dehydrogenase-like flavoprotein